jgi:cytoskeletal protein RodZ
VKKIQSFSYLATLAIAIGMISWGSALHAQTAPSTPTDQQTPQTSPDPQSPQSQQAPPSQTQDPAQAPDENAPESGSKPGSGTTATGTDSQTFSGTIMKQGDKYVLKEDSGHTYDIDHQADVAKFDGKRVHVQGTLDSTGKKIMVK